MRQTAVMLMALGGAVAICGCSIAGAWRVVSTDPPGAPFPVHVLTLDPSGSYTATGPEGTKPQTTTGQYRLSGSRLEVLEGGKVPRSFQARRRLDGALVLAYEEGGVSVSATLVRAEE